MLARWCVAFLWFALLALSWSAAGAACTHTGAEIQTEIDGGAQIIHLHPDGVYTITDRIVIGRSDLTIEGHGATIEKDFHHADMANATNYPAFLVHGASSPVKRVVIRDIKVVNIGTAAGSPVDVGYYTSLNGVPVTYDRRFNKHINTDAFVTIENATDVTVENCEATNVGRLVATYSTAAGRVVVRGNRVNGWGMVALSVGDGSVIENNVLDNSSAPVYNTTDRDADLGSSHAIYCYNGHDGITVVGNTIRSARNHAVKFDTNSGVFERTLVKGNVIEGCSWGVYVGHNATAEHQVQVVANNFWNSGFSAIASPAASVVWQSNYHHGNASQRSDSGTAQVIASEYAQLVIQGNTFDDPGACTACGGSSAENAAVAMYSSSVPNVAIVQGNVFGAGYVNGLYVVETRPGQNMKVTNNTFLSPARVRYLEDGAEIEFTGNSFDTAGFMDSSPALVSDYRRVLVYRNTFVVANGDKAIKLSALGTGQAAMLGNVFHGATTNTTALDATDAAADAINVGQNLYELAADLGATGKTVSIAP